MRTGATLTLAMLLLVSASGGSAQDQQTAAQPGMQCPMAGMMSKMPAGQSAGNMDDMMKMMGQRMAGMFSLSADEVDALLSQKKETFGLSDAQTKEIAASIQAAQQKKAAEQMERMKGQMQAGGMNCPCRGAAK